MNHYTLRAGVALQDEHAGVMIDSVGNYVAKTRSDPRSLALLLRMIADQIESDAASVDLTPTNPEEQA
ncbi:hypothetical protein ACTXJ9_10975 [Brachybacterium tyrofermentans]|uniref:hypothetical protein n=1 Tax=Brachybacterium tyrofermentans TaxID=47848 RepID=UPI003FCF0AB0